MMGKDSSMVIAGAWKGAKELGAGGIKNPFIIGSYGATPRLGK